jgi:3-(3-hydroxy-phenyl)propionate hydroxylase
MNLSVYRNNGETYTYPRFTYQQPLEIGQQIQRGIVVIGAGPAGIATAIDLAQYGLNVLLLDDDDTVSLGSRGIGYAKRALEILDRLGVGDRIVEKSVLWNVSRTFYRGEELYSVNMPSEPDHERPGMVNLQQYYLEEFLLKRAGELPNLEIRWKNKVSDVASHQTHALVEVETPDGAYCVKADWLIVADGARSEVRRLLGLDTEGKVFQDHFLIADVVMKADFPAERRFWFDPPFHPNRSVLMLPQPDNVWRIDFQLSWDADPKEEKKPERVIPRIQAMLGPDNEFDLKWASVYTFQCRRMENFRHQRLFFVGDAAHQISPFGARGASSGIQDADNLAWKLKLVVEGHAPEALLDSYSEERIAAADENIMNSTRSTDFIMSRSPVSQLFRSAVLDLSKTLGFARYLVNSGRLSVPSFLHESSLNTSDRDAFSGLMIPGAPMDDAPVYFKDEPSWLLRFIGNRFQALIYAEEAWPTQAIDEVRQAGLDGLIIEPIVIVAANHKLTVQAVGDIPVLYDVKDCFRQRFDAREGTVYLIRPDQHVAARWRSADRGQLSAALSRATSQGKERDAA